MFLRPLLPLCLLLLTCMEGLASAIPDFSQFKVYGVSRPALDSPDTARAWLAERELDKSSSHDEVYAELRRYLTYDALNHYVAFMLKIADRPDAAYFEAFSPLKAVVGEDFVTLQKESAIRALELARKIRFDVSLVKMSTKHIQRAKDVIPAGEVKVMFERLSLVSARLAELYPQGQGELPPVLIAFAASFFSDSGKGIPVSCKNPLPEQLKAQVLSSLNREATFQSSPVKTEQSPMPDPLDRPRL